MAIEAVAGSTWQTEVALTSQSSSHAFQSSPTIASGDWKKTTVTSGGTVSALSNLDNLPTVDPAGSVQVKIILSASETTAAGAGGHINIIGIDASGAEWDPIMIRVDVEAATTNGRATDIQSRLPAALVSGRIDSSVGAMASGVVTATAIASDAITAAKIADGAIDAATFAAGAITASAIAADAITDAKVASDVTIASVTGAVGSVTAGVTVTTNNDKTGYALSSAGIQAIWDVLTSALTTVGSIGKLIVDNINATISSRSSHTAANVRTEMDSNSTQLAKLGTPDGASVSADIAAIKAETASILADTGTDGVVVASGSKTGYALANDQSGVTIGTVNDLGTTARGRVNAEVLDVLNVDTFAEPAGVPAATSTLADKIRWLFALARNKVTQNSTTQALRNDADSANIATSAISDDGTTMTRGEWS